MIITLASIGWHVLNIVLHSEPLWKHHKSVCEANYSEQFNNYAALA